MDAVERAREIATKVNRIDHLSKVLAQLQQLEKFDKETKELIDTDVFYINEAINKVHQEAYKLENELYDILGDKA